MNTTYRETKSALTAHNRRVLSSSNTPEWPTPQRLFGIIDESFNFTLDPCCTAESAKCEAYFTEKDDGLAQSWAGHTVWMNPPYGRVIGDWMRKAHDESLNHGTTVVCLVPARTSSRWFQYYVLNARHASLLFLQGRLKFGSATTAAPFASALIVYSADSAIRGKVENLQQNLKKFWYNQKI